MKSSSLKAFFQAEREHCNLLVASARHQYPKFDLDDFNWFLTHCLDSVMVRFDNHTNKIAFAVAESGYRYGLELVRLNWLKNDNKKTHISLTWQGLFPLLHPLLEKDASEIFSSTGNIFSHLEDLGDDKPNRWLRLVTSVATEFKTLEQFKSVGVICTWMSGLAHYRDAALSSITNLPTDIIKTIFKLPPNHDVPSFITNIKNDRWHSPQPPSPLSSYDEFSVWHRIGKCQVLGGELTEPPLAFVENNRIYVLSGNRWWELHADIYGAILIPCDGSTIDDTPIIRINQIATLHAALKDVRKASSIAKVTNTIVVTSQDTFSVIVVSTSSRHTATDGAESD